MRQRSELTTRAELLTRDVLPALEPYVRWLKTPLGSLGSGGGRVGPLRPVPPSPGLRRLLRPSGRDGPGRGLAVDQPARALRLAGVRSDSRPRGGTRHGPDHRPQPDALGRLGRLDQGRVPPAGTRRRWRRSPVRPGLHPRPADDRTVRRVRPRLPGRISRPAAAAGLRVPVRPAGGVAADGCRGAAVGLAAHRPRRAGARGPGEPASPTGWRRATAPATGATRWASGPTAGATRSAACTGACRRGTAS